MHNARKSLVPGSNTGKIAMALSILAALGLGGLFLVMYPLQTLVVLLLGASLFVLDRG
jgi:hypothetical protein